MPRTTTSLRTTHDHASAGRPSSRLVLAGLPAAVALVAVLSGASATPAGAAVRPAPCPTVGRTLAKDTAPNLRVWREGTTMKACTRGSGERRHVRVLGPWSPATQVAVGDGTVAWTTATRSDAGVPSDRIDTVDVASGRRWLRTSRAAVAREGVAAAEDRVVRLLTTDLGTAWVTARGVVGLAVESVDEPATSFYADGAPADVHRSGRQYFLGDAGPTDAATVARGLRFVVGGEHDGCGGSFVHRLRVPAFGGRPVASFAFAELPAPAGDECG
ncbi:hypothetical protein [Patulibacter minatonensis]|uniref:hypothetical protein n=1 Tax=Patulibacter minatonensis TaxID=298163 RepID=UPI00047CBFFB|nr:hypothetical protein [Patulibacter minatonensis]